MSRLRVSVVDDDRDFADGLAEVLESWGHSVVVSRDGEDAVETHRGRRFDVTFMDVALPGMNGVESLRSIREMREDARVIIMTGYTVPDLLQEARDLGAWRVLEKPLDMNAIIGMLSDLSPRRVVLVADDDPEFQSSVAEVLVTSGFDVIEARDGTEAIDLAEAGDPHFLVLDLRMPDRAGLDVYLELEKRGIAIPTVFVTAYSEEEARAARSLRGAAEVLLKPFSPPALLKALEGAAKEKD